MVVGVEELREGEQECRLPSIRMEYPRALLLVQQVFRD